MAFQGDIAASPSEDPEGRFPLGEVLPPSPELDISFFHGPGDVRVTGWLPAANVRGIFEA